MKDYAPENLVFLYEVRTLAANAYSYVAVAKKRGVSSASISQSPFPEGRGFAQHKRICMCKAIHCGVFHISKEG